MINGPVDEGNINIIQQIKITLDQNVDMLSFNTNIQTKILEFVAKYKDIKNNRILLEILDVYKTWDERAYNNKVFELGSESQTRIREFQLANLQIKKKTSVRMDMDKEMRPQSRGGSSCGNRSLNSTQNLNATSGSMFNTQQLPGTPHEVNVMRFDDDGDGDNDNSNNDSDGPGMDRPDLNLMPISRKLSISELRKMNKGDEDGVDDINKNNSVMREKDLDSNDNISNNTPRGSISMQRRSISEQRTEGNNKENEVSRRKLPPAMPSQKRKSKLEPLKQSGNNNVFESDVFQEDKNGFDLSFNGDKKNRNLHSNSKKRNEEEDALDTLDFIF